MALFINCLDITEYLPSTSGLIVLMYKDQEGDLSVREKVHMKEVCKSRYSCEEGTHP